MSLALLPMKGTTMEAMASTTEIKAPECKHTGYRWNIRINEWQIRTFCSVCRKQLD